MREKPKITITELRPCKDISEVDTDNLRAEDRNLDLLMQRVILWSKNHDINFIKFLRNEREGLYAIKCFKCNEVFKEELEK